MKQCNGENDRIFSYIRGDTDIMKIMYFTQNYTYNRFLRLFDYDRIENSNRYYITCF